MNSIAAFCCVFFMQNRQSACFDYQIRNKFNEFFIRTECEVDIAY